MTLMPPRVLCPILLFAFAISACATTPDRSTEWIQAGKTTKADVVERYGEPDLVQVSSEGEIATYRPFTHPQSIEVPMAQAGPLGTTTTKTQTIDPGLGRRDVAGTTERPRKEIHIHYDSRGIVREVLE